MKKLLLPLFCFLLLSLTGCSAIVRKISDTFINGPESVTIEGVTYRRGFYGEQLYPAFGYSGDIGRDMLQEEIIYDDGKYKYQRIDYEGHDWIHSNGGSTTAGVVYCAENEWEQAKAYYADSDNFVYYFSIGVKNVAKGIVPVVTEIPDIDSEKFDMLITFFDENSYIPFNLIKNEKAYPLPIPDKEESPPFFFYRESKDGLFFSAKGYDLYVENDKLVLLYYYDHGYGEYEEMLVVDFPEELSQYFVELVAHVEFLYDMVLPLHEI